jgi:[acyl-carrier-protein] S-malonyltransferase
MTVTTAATFGVAFPGQGNKRQDVLDALDTFREHPVVAEFHARFGSDPDALDFNDTAVAQPATYATGIAAAQAGYGRAASVPLVIGHSLGELTAAAFAGIIDVWDGFHLAVRRGEVCRDLGRPGSMLAVMGARGQDIEWLRRTVLASTGGVLEVAGFNGTRQTVLSGDHRAVVAAIEAAGEFGMLAEILPIGGSFHSPLMSDALPTWRGEVEGVDFRASTTTLLSTVDAQLHEDPLEIRELLIRALLLPVRWTEAVNAARAAGVEVFYDAGPGPALTKLGRREGVVKFRPLPVAAEVLT